MKNNLEAVKLDLGDIENVPFPYRNYYEGRNSFVAKLIAAYLGLPYQDATSQTSKGKLINSENLYHVPRRTLTTNEAVHRGIFSGDFDRIYGLAIDDLRQVDKSILHPSKDKRLPSFYSQEFAMLLSRERLVLEGCTCFSEASLIEYLNYKLLTGQSQRIKLTGKSDGHGQYTIHNLTEIQKVISQIGCEYSDGVVVEPNLSNPLTISAGIVKFEKQTFAFIANQYDGHRNDGTNIFLGGDVLVFRGTRIGADLLDYISIDEQKAFRLAMKFIDHFHQFTHAFSRVSVDIVSGTDSLGQYQAGVADITGRLGGLCPGILLAIQRGLALDHKKLLQKASVRLEYNPLPDLKISSQDFKVLDEPSLLITASLK